jgi:hypothetical protein
VKPIFLEQTKCVASGITTLRFAGACTGSRRGHLTPCMQSRTPHMGQDEERVRTQDGRHEEQQDADRTGEEQYMEGPDGGAHAHRQPIGPPLGHRAFIHLEPRLLGLAHIRALATSHRESSGRSL